MTGEPVGAPTDQRNRMGPSYRLDPVPLAITEEPMTDAGREMVRFWLNGRTHPPSTQRIRDFVDHILAIEAAAARAEGPRLTVEALAKALVDSGIAEMAYPCANLTTPTGQPGIAAHRWAQRILAALAPDAPLEGT